MNSSTSTTPPEPLQPAGPRQVDAPAAQPPLLVTLGDPAGIGPEIVARAWSMGALDDAVIVGDPAVFHRGRVACGLQDAGDRPLPPFWSPPDPPSSMALPPVDWASLPWGRVDARCGWEVARCLKAAVGHALAGRGRAVVTGPLHKEALAAAGIGFPGHTEMLQAWSGHHPPVRMMLANGELKVVLVTIHMSLRQAIDAITTDAVLQTLCITDAALRRWGIAQPRIAVAGLNPHAGEGGLFGDEEIRVIAPAIDQAQRMGVRAQGPYPPDTVFMRARQRPGHESPFDVVVAMTHDHGLIPVKYLGVEQGVNITLGLPFVRTSPDHGTAFDIAGQGVADPSSFIEALVRARELTAGAREVGALTRP